jgi:hypothetical protein
MTIYPHEREAGLAGELSQNRIAIAAVAEPSNDATPGQKARASLFSTASATDPDLFRLQAVLVTASADGVWNLNDDVFLSNEVWQARATPIRKKFDYEHVDNDIIGHIVTCGAVDADTQATLADDLAADSLPAKIHLQIGAVLYRVWEQKALKRRMDSIIKELPEGKWFVSMECLFAGFDYAMQEESGATKIVKRDASTAFLTKYLRSYGGDGTYDGKRLGRVLRGILFTGQGLVRKPANLDSTIVTTASAASPQEQQLGEIIRNFKGTVQKRAQIKDMASAIAAAIISDKV